ncbi:hypothetical protein CFL01nite_06400 [Corynebacterium flavescens]|uniref:Uncharacterized protein n=1 Tax=Corynebacterium flavescens TaxID=28028 RepID=A0AB73B5H1_CORFL|nr:hypothetical protein CFL01nite_06400 [Corynebacterium flavescens]
MRCGFATVYSESEAETRVPAPQMRGTDRVVLKKKVEDGMIATCVAVSRKTIIRPFLVALHCGAPLCRLEYFHERPFTYFLTNNGAKAHDIARL